MTPTAPEKKKMTPEAASDRKSRISVVIAAYRGEKYIASQLASLFAQTRKIDEIVIGDDSPDSVFFDLATEIARTAPCPVLIERNTARLGPAANFAAAMGRATGDLIFLCDQDDVWLPEKVERLASELEAHPDCEVVFCNSAVTDSALRGLGYSTADIVRFTRKKADDINAGKGFIHILRTPMFYGHNIAFRRAFLRFALPMPALDAHDLWIAELSAGRGKARCVFEELTLHRRHGGNQSMQNRPAGFFLRACNLLIRRIDNTEIRDSFIHAAAAAERLLAFKEECPAENLEALCASAEYYKARLALSGLDFFSRLSAVASVRGYFKYGYGFRSIFRDIFLPLQGKNIRPD